MKRALLETGRWTIGHAAGCLSKAEALANILDANGFSAATAKDFGVGQWHMTALIAEVPDPSPETQAIVVRMLQDKDAARAAAGEGFSISGTSSAFEAWLAGYRGRLERFVKNARCK